MSDFTARLSAHLSKFRAAPFLFVGAGVSRRYLGLDDWPGLLGRLAALTGRDYAYYHASADGDYARIATLLAKELHEPWWAERRFSKSRKRFEGQLKRSDSALKAEASLYLADSLDALPTSGLLAEELAIMREIVIDGVVTTNFDPLLEHVFPDFRVFVGQEELLFEDPQGVGEVYKIHGSHERPDSLVLTEADYERFHANNPYLAAKLLTIFVEHPVVFVGYSLTDPNVTAILTSIVSCLDTQERIDQLTNRLIFVQWNPDAEAPAITPGAVPVEGGAIPVLSAVVPDYLELFEVLAGLRRGFPAKLLRQLKEQVYELVLEDDPKGRLHVMPLEQDADPAGLDVVFGVGAIAQLRAYAGLTRDDLVDDVLHGTGGYNAVRVVQEALPPLLSHPGNLPVYMYLREAGMLDDQGDLVDADNVDRRVAKHLEIRPSRLGVVKSSQERAARGVAEAGTFALLAGTCPAHQVITWVAAFDDAALDPDDLKAFLVANEALRHTGYGSQWTKTVCLWDWLTHGRPQPSPARDAARPRRKTTASVSKRPAKSTARRRIKPS